MLHVLPRGGGVLDQPADEIMHLEQILRAYSRYDDYEQGKSNVRKKNRERHAEQVTE